GSTATRRSMQILLCMGTAAGWPPIRPRRGQKRCVRWWRIAPYGGNWPPMPGASWPSSVCWPGAPAIGSPPWWKCGMTDPAVSIVIERWDGAAVIPAVLEALSVARAQIPDESEIVVVDNGSTDGGADWVAAHYRPPGVTLIRNGRNLGFAGACNAGLRAARGERLVLLNQDTQVEPSWLAQLIAGLDQAPAIAGSLALLEDGETIQHAGGIIDWPLGL